MDRRTLFRIAGSVGVTVPLSGCASMFSSDGADLKVSNDGDTTRDYEVVVDGPESRTTAGKLAAGESTTVGNFLPYLDYGHTADVRVLIDGAIAETATLTIETDVEWIYVDIVEGDTAEIRPTSIHSPTPPEY